MPTDKCIKQKIKRLMNGGVLRVLDLFSGCGGLSLGFKAAGCEIAAAVEYDQHAAYSHGMNFHPGDERHSKPRDITRIKPENLAQELNLGEIGNAFDLIVGGPPCQAFARVGRSKLREVADHPEAYRHDPRSRLYIDYLNYVESCKPLAVVMENVPDMLNHGGHNIAHEVAEVLLTKGYVCRYTLLNAVHYGVPQMRERMFLIAISDEIVQDVCFPKPTHSYSLPSGYDGARNYALKNISLKNTLYGDDIYYIKTPAQEEGLLPAVTAKEALDDLPFLDARKLLESGKLKRGARRFDQPLEWRGKDRISDFAKIMRTWLGYEGSEMINDHVIRYLPRDFPLFAKLKPGDQYPQAYELAEGIFKKRLAEIEKDKKRTIEDESVEWHQLRDSIVPPYDPGKFPNKWRKMESDAPCRTLMAHLGKDGYSHIHYDSRQARTISVREAARLQSFPDGFIFCGTMNPAFQQIGNAVPPLLSKAIAQALTEQLSKGIG